MLGKLIGKVVAAPIKAVVTLPDTAADALDEISKAFDPPKKPRR